jgi:hypothetical protein
LRAETKNKKSIICRNGESCKYGAWNNNGVNRCDFCHPWEGEKGHVCEETTRKHKKSGKFKFKDCMHWLKHKGLCPYGDGCAFKHDPKQKAAVVVQCAWRCYLTHKRAKQERDKFVEETIVYLEILGAGNAHKRNLAVLEKTNMKVKHVSNETLEGASRRVLMKEEFVMPMPMTTLTRQTSDELLKEVFNSTIEDFNADIEGLFDMDPFKTVKHESNCHLSFLWGK